LRVQFVTTHQPKCGGFGGLTGFVYICFQGQRVTLKHGGNPHSGYVWTVSTHAGFGNEIQPKVPFFTLNSNAFFSGYFFTN